MEYRISPLSGSDANTPNSVMSYPAVSVLFSIVIFSTSAESVLITLFEIGNVCFTVFSAVLCEMSSLEVYEPLPDCAFVI
nr:MAG: hypothetical protein [Bacteriophage sp.]